LNFKPKNVPLLKRKLGFWHVYFICVGLVICSGESLVVARGFGSIGLNFVLSMLIGFAAMSLVVYSLSRWIRILPKAESIGGYVEMGFGPYAGVLVALLYWLQYLFWVSAEIVIVSDIVNSFLPTAPWTMIVIALLTLFAAVNLIGILEVGISQIAMGAFMIVSSVATAMIVLGGLGSSSFDGSRLTGLNVNFNAIAFYTPLATWLYVGTEAAGPVSEETKDSGKKAFRVMMLSLLTIFSTQALLGLAWLGICPQRILVDSPFPHIVAAQEIFGGLGVTWWAIVSLVATGSTMNAAYTVTSRVIFGLARKGHLPKALSSLHPSYATPWSVITVTYVLYLVLCLLIPLPLWLIEISTALYLVVYTLVMLSLVAYARRKKHAGKGSNVHTQDALVSAAGSALLVALLALQFFADATVLLVSGAVIIASAILIAIHRWKARFMKVATREAGIS